MSDSFHVSLCIVAVTFFVLCTRPVCNQVLYYGPRHSDEGETFTITCVAPIFESIKWSLNGDDLIVRDPNVEVNNRTVIRNNSTTENPNERPTQVLSSLRVLSAMANHTGNYKCVSVPGESRSHRHFVISASLMEISSNQSLELEKEMVIWCNASDHLVKWSKDGEPISSDDRLMVSGSKVTISRANRGDAGEYTCRIHGADDSNTVKSTRIFVNTTAKFSAKSYNLEQGGTLMLECKVDGDPLPRVTWYRDEELLIPDGSGIRVLPNDKGVENAKLEIADLDFEDRANYTCIAENDFSSAKAFTFVRVKDKFAALWPFLGIVAEVIILVVIIFCYERKRAKSEEEDDADTPAAASRSTDGSKGDVRQRK